MKNRVGFYIVLVAVLIYSLGPYGWQFLTSIKTENELMKLPPILPTSPTFAHYIVIFKEHPFWRIILNSTVVAILTTLLSLILGSLCAFGLAKLRIKYKALILGFILSVSMFPPIATVSPLYIILRFLGLRDTWWALIITYSSFSLPLAIWILTNFFKEIPEDLYLAAWVDGCTTWQSFYKIVLPLAAPGLFSTAILVFIFSWNEFLLALTFTSSPASRTIPVAIALFPGRHEIPWGEISAASIIVTIPLILLILACQRRIVAGLTAGALKG